MKNLPVLLIFFLISQSLVVYGQTNPKFAQRMLIGSSLTYIRYSNPELRSNFHEWTWNKNIAVNLNKSLYFGLSYFNIHTSGSIERRSTNKNKQNYSLVGAFFQYDLLPKNRKLLFFELSWNLGNYCTCEFGDPFKKPKLNYLGAGGGFDFPITKYLSVDLGLVGYAILNKIPQKDGYTQYVLGLNIDLIK